jgi:hypothetical protein
MRLSKTFVLLTKAKLIDACIIKFGGWKTTYEGITNEALVERLLTYQLDSIFLARSSHPQPEGFFLVQSALLKQIVKLSFLPRLTAKGKEFCKLGHKLEIPLARKLLHHSEEVLTLFQVEKVYCVGLVAKNDEADVKASCDFVAVAVIDGEKHLVGIECKARVTPCTHEQEMRQAEFLSHFHRAGDHQQQT